MLLSSRSEVTFRVDQTGLIVRVLPTPDSDTEDLADLAGLLRDDLLSADADVRPLAANDVPEGAKGLGTVVGSLLVGLGAPDGLPGVLAAIRLWAARTKRTAEISIGGDTLKVSGVSSREQEKIVDAWLARHPAGD